MPPPNHYHKLINIGTMIKMFHVYIISGQKECFTLGTDVALIDSAQYGKEAGPII
jgi:hypothetical protein